MTIFHDPLTTMKTLQNALVHTKTSNVQLVQSTNRKNNQQLGGKNKIKKKNSTSSQGTAPDINSNVGSTNEKNKMRFTCNTYTRYHPTHKFS